MTETIEQDPAFVAVKENSAREAARDMTVTAGGGVQVGNWAQLVDLAKYMSTSNWAVRKELRNNVGACIAIIDLATRWGFSHWQLARVCYVVNDILCFESQVIHAVIEKFAPLKYRLRPTYEGEGAHRKVKIVGHMKGELEPLEYESPEIGGISPKNSPLWKTDPDQQLFYLASQRWCKRYCPDVLLGIHDVDQVDSPSIAPIGFENAKDVTPKLGERLGALTDDGFAGEKTLAGIDEALESAREAKGE
jgi:hypothetical protein